MKVRREMLKTGVIFVFLLMVFASSPVGAQGNPKENLRIDYEEYNGGARVDAESALHEISDRIAMLLNNTGGWGDSEKKDRVILVRSDFNKVMGIEMDRDYTAVMVQRLVAHGLYDRFKKLQDFRDFMGDLEDYVLEEFIPPSDKAGLIDARNRLEGFLNSQPRADFEEIKKALPRTSWITYGKLKAGIIQARRRLRELGITEASDYLRIGRGFQSIFEKHPILLYLHPEKDISHFRQLITHEEVLSRSTTLKSLALAVGAYGGEFRISFGHSANGRLTVRINVDKLGLPASLSQEIAVEIPEKDIAIMDKLIDQKIDVDSSWKIAKRYSSLSGASEAQRIYSSTLQSFKVDPRHYLGDLLLLRFIPLHLLTLDIPDIFLFLKQSEGDIPAFALHLIGDLIGKSGKTNDFIEAVISKRPEISASAWDVAERAIQVSNTELKPETLEESLVRLTASEEGDIAEQAARVARRYLEQRPDPSISEIVTRNLERGQARRKLPELLKRLKSASTAQETDVLNQLKDAYPKAEGFWFGFWKLIHDPNAIVQFRALKFVTSLEAAWGSYLCKQMSAEDVGQLVRLAHIQNRQDGEMSRLVLSLLERETLRAHFFPKLIELASSSSVQDLTPYLWEHIWRTIPPDLSENAYISIANALRNLCNSSHRETAMGALTAFRLLAALNPKHQDFMVRAPRFVDVATAIIQSSTADELVRTWAQMEIAARQNEYIQGRIFQFHLATSYNSGDLITEGKIRVFAQQVGLKSDTVETRKSDVGRRMYELEFKQKEERHNPKELEYQSRLWRTITGGLDENDRVMAAVVLIETLGNEWECLAALEYARTLNNPKAFALISDAVSSRFGWHFIRTLLFDRALGADGKIERIVPFWDHIQRFVTGPKSWWRLDQEKEVDVRKFIEYIEQVTDSSDPAVSSKASLLLRAVHGHLLQSTNEELRGMIDSGRRNRLEEITERLWSQGEVSSEEPPEVPRDPIKRPEHFQEELESPVEGKKLYIDRQTLLGGERFKVYLGFLEDPDTGLGQEVAIKMAEEDSGIARLDRQKLVQAEIKNPNVVKIYGVSQGASPPFLVMEAVLGGTVRDLIEAHKEDGVYTLSLADGVEIVYRIGLVLKDAHSQNLIHGDIKPDNVLLTPAPESRVKVTDFEPNRSSMPADVMISKSLQPSLDGVVGTRAYLTPEVLVGEQIDSQTDVCTLGKLLFEVLVGRVPQGFESIAPEEVKNVNPEILSQIDALFRKTQLRRERRPTMAEVVSELEKIRRRLPQSRLDLAVKNIPERRTRPESPSPIADSIEQPQEPAKDSLETKLVEEPVAAAAAQEEPTPEVKKRQSIDAFLKDRAVPTFGTEKRLLEGEDPGDAVADDIHKGQDRGDSSSPRPERRRKSKGRR